MKYEVLGVKLVACGSNWWLLLIVLVSSVPILRICVFLLRYVLIRWLCLALINYLNSPSTVIRASLGVAIMIACLQSIIYLSVNEKIKSSVVLFQRFHHKWNKMCGSCSYFYV